MVRPMNFQIQDEDVETVAFYCGSNEDVYAAFQRIVADRDALRAFARAQPDTSDRMTLDLREAPAAMVDQVCRDICELAGAGHPKHSALRADVQRAWFLAVNSAEFRDAVRGHLGRLADIRAIL